MKKQLFILSMLAVLSGQVTCMGLLKKLLKGASTSNTDELTKQGLLAGSKERFENLVEEGFFGTNRQRALVEKRASKALEKIQENLKGQWTRENAVNFLEKKHKELQKPTLPSKNNRPKSTRFKK